MMSLSTYRKNNYIPLSSFPDVVIYHIAQYLGPRDLGNMRKVNQHFRQLFNSPWFWKGTKIVMPSTSWNGNSALKMDPCVLKTIELRGITELELIHYNHKAVERDIDLILQCLPCLEALSLYSTTPKICRSLERFAWSGHLDKLKKLSFGHISRHCWKISNREHIFTRLLEKLPRLQTVSCIIERIGCGWAPSSLQLQLGNDLPRAFCQCGQLTSISLMNVIIYRSCLSAILRANPHLQTLSFGFISGIVIDDDLVDPAVCSNLTSLELHHFSDEDTITNILNLAIPGSGPNRNLTSMNLSYSQSTRVFEFFSKFPALKTLNLKKFRRFLQNMSFKVFRHLQNLEWLELHGCDEISGKEILELSASFGRTLRYLGLAELILRPYITDLLRNLASMFPVLEALDLSGCTNITDALLVEWYMKHDEKGWPKLRKLLLKGCGVSQEVVNSVRLKTRNQLLVEL